MHFLPWSKALRFKEIKLPLESLGCSVPRAKVKEDRVIWTEVGMYLLNTANSIIQNCWGKSKVLWNLPIQLWKWGINFTASHSGSCKQVLEKTLWVSLDLPLQAKPCKKRKCIICEGGAFPLCNISYWPVAGAVHQPAYTNELILCVKSYVNAAA